MEKINLIDLINDTNIKIMKNTDNMEGIKVSELQMHKVLFILYGEFYANYHQELFDANFQAWKYGPVEIDYRKQNCNKFNILIDEQQKKFLEKRIEILLKKGAWLLVDFTHNLNSWIDNYNENNYQNIPNDEIKMDFENLSYFK